jgi:hypothetical protein
MNFERNIDTKEALQIGWNRRLKKGDKFILIVPSYKEIPEQEYIVIATEDETSHDHWYVEKSSRDSNIPDEMDFYEIRQVKWCIPEVSQGYAQMKDNCEHPRWIFVNNGSDIY